MCRALVSGGRRKRTCQRAGEHVWFEFDLCAQHIGQLRDGKLKAVVEPNGDWVSEVRWDFARGEYVPFTPERPTPPYPFPWPQMPLESRRVPIEVYNAEQADERETA